MLICAGKEKCHEIVLNIMRILCTGKKKCLRNEPSGEAPDEVALPPGVPVEHLEPQSPAPVPVAEIPDGEAEGLPARIQSVLDDLGAVDGHVVPASYFPKK